MQLVFWKSHTTDQRKSQLSHHPNKNRDRHGQNMPLTNVEFRGAPGSDFYYPAGYWICRISEKNPAGYWIFYSI